MQSSIDPPKLPCGCTLRTEKYADGQLRVFVRAGLFCKASLRQETLIAKDSAHARDLLETRYPCTRFFFRQADRRGCSTRVGVDETGVDPNIFFIRRIQPELTSRAINAIPDGNLLTMTGKKRAITWDVPSESECEATSAVNGNYAWVQPVPQKQRRMLGDNSFGQESARPTVQHEVRSNQGLLGARSSDTVARAPMQAGGLFASIDRRRQAGIGRTAAPHQAGTLVHAGKASTQPQASATVPAEAEPVAMEARRPSELQLCWPRDTQTLPENQQEIRFEDLSCEQQAAAQQVSKGESVFITGAAGTGKSRLLQYLVAKLRFEKGDAGVAVTASTGAAAVNIGGCTLHSFAGVGVSKSNHPDTLLQKVLHSQAREGWKMCQILIIDEISMVDALLFDALEYIARNIRGNELPFGGLQLICCGDFLQLPPVPAGRFCFESRAWQFCRLREGTIILQQVHRQSCDAEFIQLLHEVRRGRCSEEMLTRLHECHVDRKALPLDGVLPTKLYCNNGEVDKENQQCLAELGGELHVYEARDSFRGVAGSNLGQQTLLSQLANKSVPVRLELKEEAQVVLVRNLFGPLVNGSRGVVISCGKLPVVQFDCGVTKVIEEYEFTFYAGPGSYMVRSQLPIRLGWAITVHKSQGMSLSRAELSLQGAFAFGQVYVALSRVASLAGLWLRTKISRPIVRAHPTVLAYYFA